MKKKIYIGEEFVLIFYQQQCDSLLFDRKRKNKKKIGYIIVRGKIK